MPSWERWVAWHPFRKQNFLLGRDKRFEITESRKHSMFGMTDSISRMLFD